MSGETMTMADIAAVQESLRNGKPGRICGTFEDIYREIRPEDSTNMSFQMILRGVCEIT
jgi:hypothetical protein